MNLTYFTKIFSLSLILIVFSFLINNYLTFAGEWPGPLSITEGVKFFLCTQTGLYLLSILIPVIYFYFQDLSISDLADKLESFNDYIIRFAFWSVFIIGIVDAIISFLIIEGFLEQIAGKSWNIKFSNNSFRAPYIHFPLLFISLFLALIYKNLNFFWLAFLVVIAEFQIVILRFVFSYEQTLMSDLVRFWYGSLFLFASYYTLIREGHVRIDVFYANLSKKNKAKVNLFGSLILGIPLCLNNFFSRECLANNVFLINL